MQPHEQREHWGLLTPFGHGLCAFVGAGFAVFSLVSVLPGYPRQLVLVGPLAASLLAALTAAALGRRLACEYRCSYEHLLLAVMCAGPLLTLPVMAGVTGPDALLSIWSLLVAGAYLLLRRYGYRVGPDGEVLSSG